MRTVDPDLWSKRAKKPILNLTRPYKFGLKYSPLEVRLRSSLKDALKELWKHSGVQGPKFVADKNINPMIRWCYLLLLIATFIASLSLVVQLWYVYRMVPPLIVNELMEDDVLNNITFPAVAICSNNVISKPALDKYARYLLSLDRNRTYALNSIKSNLMAFGALFNMAFTPYEHDFMKWLVAVTKETNVTKIMYELTPPCRTLLVRCAWHARAYRCAELFTRRITPFGFCCVFNSRYMSMDRDSTLYQLNETGIAAGLAVVARENPDDFAFIRRPGYEFLVLLFDGDNYPLLSSGMVRVFLAPCNTSSLIMLKTYTQYASYDLDHYSEEMRGCRLPGSNGEFDLHSWSTCLMVCQRNAAIALCNCAPFTMPDYDGDEAPECTLEHLHCLAKHREKFRFFFPGDTSDESLNEEEVNSLYCMGPEACMPDCTRQLHTARVTMIRHDNDTRVLKTNFLKGLDMTNATIISIFYESDTQKLTIIETNNPWYEVIGLLCCMEVFILSITLVNVFEVVYFCTIRWIYHYRRRKRLLQLLIRKK
ncbi:sodium channel protein Nach-like isoform X2 [Aricia agestis]|uniref:sodium channel protein Nach-like isoform X2 n=1 Tax=Aricia agestis TaxID=91739 RepID=UPI001C202DAE|nr:sodium channel protein Nach-like isoform X2 [Aricia agestis]